MAPGCPAKRPEGGAPETMGILVIPGALEIVRTRILTVTWMRW
jgi:hypothetical protein